MSSLEYYYNNDEETLGPFQISDLKTLFVKKEITKASLIWEENMSDWQPLSDLPALLKLIRPKPKPVKKGRCSNKNLPPPLPMSKKKKASRSRAHSWRSDPKNKASQAHSSDDDENENRRSNFNQLRNFFGKSKSKKKGMVKKKKTKKTKSVHSNEASNWEERWTIEGLPYYFNESREELTWDKPSCLKTAEECEKEAADWCWVKSSEFDNREEGHYVAARFVRAKSNGGLICEVDCSGRRIHLKKEEVENLWRFAPSELSRLEQDVVMLDHVNEAQITHNLAERFRKNQIYTWLGASKTVLISINPFKWLGLYSPTYIKQHRRPPPNKRLEPHVFDIANHALNTLLLDKTNQAILISGESGAGKTECAKQCFSFLTESAGSIEDDEDVGEKILLANPLLEAFGNAKTLRNDNSSRFGKWVEIQFNSRGKIAGARAENYLLEKCRVIKQADGERNYHIFYQLFSSQRMKQRYKLTNGPESFRYLSSNCFTADGIDDSKDFEEMQTAMVSLGFSKDQQTWVFDTVAGVLWLGNIRFKKKISNNVDGSKVSSAKALKQASVFLGLTEAKLEKILTERSIEVTGRKTTIPLTPNKALDATDALAKAIYGRLFSWLVARTNDATAATTCNAKNFIGVLDIFGFEIFENNSFEQLCINYANEKLQQHFNKHTFKEEESVYQQEKIEYDPIDFIDNQPVLDLIENSKRKKVKNNVIPQGLLLWLDDEVRVPKGSDENFVKKCDKAFSALDTNVYSKCQSLRRGGKKAKNKLLFSIQHYAGHVVYSCKGFLEKNKDALFEDLYDAMSKSKSSYMTELFRPKKSRSRKQQTISERFRIQLRNLMNLLHKTEPSYIRCIKPNHLKLSGIKNFDATAVIEQLRYAGVFEAVHIRKSGYPFRLTHKQFAARYRCTLLRSDGRWQPLRARAPNYQEVCEELLKTMQADVDEVAVGQTMILYRAKEHRLMELLRHLALSRIVPTCQRVMRGYLAREVRRRLVKAEHQLLIALSKETISALESAIEKSTELIGSLINFFDVEPPSLKQARDLIKKLKLWLKLEKKMEALIDVNINGRFYNDAASCVSRGFELEQQNIPASPKQIRLLKNLKKRLHACTAARIDPEAEEALFLLDKERMEKVVDEAAKAAYQSSDLKKIMEFLKLPMEEQVKLQLKKAVELDDPVRKANREIWLTNQYIEKNRSWLHFSDFSQLREPFEFANASWLIWKKEELCAGMLKYTSSRVEFPTSLTKIPAKLIPGALLSFKTICRYMKGGRDDDDNLAHELVLRLLDQWESRGEYQNQNGNEGKLATEIYCQLIKQLSENPNPVSERKGWQLLSILVSFVKPGPGFAEFFLVFVKENAPQQKAIVSTIHETHFGQQLSQRPSLAMIRQAARRVSGRTNRSRWSRKVSLKLDEQKIKILKKQERQRYSRKQVYEEDEEEETEDDGEEEEEMEEMEDEEFESEEETEDEEFDSEDEEEDLDSEEEEALASDEVWATAEFDFDARDETCINIAEGDRMVILEELEDGWSKVRLEGSGEEGYVPGNYLKKD
eukprot:g4877.t1